MRFDYTHGEEAKYMVSIYGWNVEDKYCLADKKRAEDLFQRVIDNHNLDEGTLVTLYDLRTTVPIKKHTCTARG